MRWWLRHATKRSAFLHCRARARKRYGLDLSEASYDMLCALAAKANKIPRSRTKTWYVEVQADRLTVKGVWDGNRLVTLLPPDAEPPYLRAA